ncbi:hypothetical protein [Paenibacillus tepidiphilus]|nr:hypothetical protein [Paenibacillus tepidiphilus]
MGADLFEMSLGAGDHPLLFYLVWAQ